MPRPAQPRTRITKGDCPRGAKLDPKRKCFAHDPQCGCHGPIMTQGMVAWAGGGTGPDFFIYTGAGPNTWWNFALATSLHHLAIDIYSHARAATKNPENRTTDDQSH